MAVQVVGTSGVIADVNADHEMKVSVSNDADRAGIIAAAGETGSVGDPGGRLLRPMEVSTDYRLRVGTDQVAYHRYLAGHNARPPEIYEGTSSMTVAWTGGGVGALLNSGSATAATTVAVIKTFRSFRPIIAGGMSAEMVIRWTAIVTNNEWWVGFTNNSAVAAPGDGIYMRRTTAGALKLCVNLNGAETQSADIDESSIAIDQRHHVQIAVGTSHADAFIDGALVATVRYPGSGAGRGFATAQAFNLTAAIRNASTAPIAAQLYVYEWGVSLLDYTLNRPFAHAQAGMEQHLPLDPRGGTTNGSFGFGNNATFFSGPTSLSNTTPPVQTAFANGFFNAVAGGNSDYIILAHLPGGDSSFSATGMMPNLYVTGIRVDCFVRGAAIATTPTVISWMVGVGSTGTSLATTDTGASRQPRRMPIGTMVFPVGAAVDTILTIDKQFSTPLFVPGGSYFHVLFKAPIGTATASQTFYYQVTPEGFFE